jgi:hypothetical protein
MLLHPLPAAHHRVHALCHVVTETSWVRLSGLSLNLRRLPQQSSTHVLLPYSATGPPLALSPAAADLCPRTL